MDSLGQDVEDLLRRVAEDEILSRFGKLQPADIKCKGHHGDKVTTADLEAEQRIRDGLLKLLPDSVVVGEEEAYKSPEILHRLHGKKPVWVVDPVDGTGNFAKAHPCFAVICALVEGGETQRGWILDPVGGICITAEKGAGTYVDGQRLTIHPPLDGLKSMTGSVGKGVQKYLEKHSQKEGPKHFVRYHCVGREYMDIALGKIHFALYGGKMMPWDHAAGVLLVTEAGGIAAISENNTPYSPQQTSSDAPLLIAPDKASFKALVPLLTEKKS